MAAIDGHSWTFRKQYLAAMSIRGERGALHGQLDTADPPNGSWRRPSETVLLTKKRLKESL